MGMIYCDGNNSLRRAECIATGIIACDGNDSATGMMNGNDGTQEKNFECSECGKVFGQRGYLCRMCNCHFYQQGHQVGAELRGPSQHEYL